MRALVLSLVLLVLFSCGLCAQEAYPRPWENDGWIAQNEYISTVGAFEFWHVMEPTGNISKMDALALMFPFHESLEQGEVGRLFEECDPEFCVCKDELGTSLRYAKWAGDAIKYTQLDQVFMATIHTDPAAGLYAWNLYTYVGNWKNAMEYALMAAEEEGVQLNANRMAMERQVGKIRYSGICDPDYAGPENSICNSPPDDVACNSSGLWNDIPDMKWYPLCIMSEWETGRELKAETQRLNSEFSTAVSQLDEMEAIVGAKAAAASDAIARLKENELNKIYLSGQSTDIAGTASIRVGYARLLSDFSAAENSERYAGAVRKKQANGWYKLAYNALYDANKRYENVIYGSERLMEDAEGVVLAARGKAHEELAAAEEAGGRLTQNGQRHLELAQQACALGDSEILLGPRFDNYGMCRMHAKIALRNMETEEMAELEVAISEARAAITRAEHDGIDVSAEKALLRIVETQRPANSLSILQRIRESIPEKAKIKYSGLPEERKNLVKTIDAGGSSLAFLKTWLEGEECYSGDELDYWCALGRLSDIKESYARVGEEIQLKSSEAVANALFVEYYETTTAASLVDESRYELVVKAENPLGIGAENVVFGVPASVEVRSVDLVEGKAIVRAVAYENGIAAIQLRNISPGEAITLHFAKTYVPCRSTSYSKHAVGDGNGNAIITENYGLDCSVAVGSIDTGADAGVATLDGRQSRLEHGILRGWVQAGRHELVLEREVNDVYSVREGGISATTIGGKTKVEYMLEILSTMDLKKVPLIIDESEKEPAKIDLFAYTGERISGNRELGKGVVYFEVEGVDAGKTAQVRVRYEFSNSSEYVRQRIEQLREAGLGSEALAYLNNASNLYALGNYDGAMAALEGAETQMEKDARARARLMQKHQELYDEISRKASELRESIGLAENLGVGSIYSMEMRARLDYLEEMLAKNLTGAETASPLESVDLGWERKELAKIQKHLNENEARIKKEWMKLGIEDANTSEAIRGLEEASATFSGTMKFRDGILALAAVEKANEKLATAGEIAGAAMEKEKKALARMVEEARSIAADYSEERNALPRGHHLTSLFEKSPSWIQNRLSSLEKSDDVGGAIDEVTALKSEMVGVLNFLKKEAQRLGDTANEIYAENKGEMNEDAREKAEALLRDADRYFSGKEYSKAIMAYENAISAAEGGKEDDYGLLILAVTALLVIGIVLLLLLGEARPGLPGAGVKNQAKKLRRIQKEEDFE